MRRILRTPWWASVRIGRRGGPRGSYRRTSSRRAFRGSPDTGMIRVVLPGHLRALARVSSEIQLDVKGPVTQRSVLDALEAQYPMLRGTIRDHLTQARRPFLRLFACSEDYSLEPPDTPLPDALASGSEPLLIIGAIAGG